MEIFMKVTICSETVPYTAKDGTVPYPEGMNECLKSFISEENEVRLVVIDKDSDGSALTDELLSDTNVLVWWGHMFHKNIKDEVVELLAQYVQRGMGLVALHSAHKSKLLMRLLGTPCDLSWREIGEHERLWCIDPTHPIAEGLNVEHVLIPHEEMYGEPFSIPTPDELVFIGWFRGGEVMRAGCVFKRARGKIFFFQPGHETLPTYKIPEIQLIIKNAIRYVAPVGAVSGPLSCKHVSASPEGID